jgi:hypothetical protein
MLAVFRRLCHTPDLHVDELGRLSEELAAFVPGERVTPTHPTKGRGHPLLTLAPVTLPETLDSPAGPQQLWQAGFHDPSVAQQFLEATQRHVAHSQHHGGEFVVLPPLPVASDISCSLQIAQFAGGQILCYDRGPVVPVVPRASWAEVRPTLARMYAHPPPHPVTTADAWQEWTTRMLVAQ